MVRQPLNGDVERLNKGRTLRKARDSKEELKATLKGRAGQGRVVGPSPPSLNR